ncbi:MAG TPA: hypothetical protein VEA80_01680 [Vitreimonas sp.]|uniref:hypothetical protein n=1 Tax=Vitreimonas sp. TaxID=3069702 RepID=UPI002D2A1457|nr:hypothetical protein [Vitreimonas sp.]HYD86160.1 hypothetical protein [Vitreimonas sp.]
MLRKLVLGLALAASACAPAPPSMPATDAIELLERFAAGAAGIDVCSPQGRATLRGAVRSYSAEMEAAGVAWPTLPDEGALKAVDVTVVMALVSGFVEPSDLDGRARALAGGLMVANFPQVRDFHRAARVACAELVELQQTASRYAIERQRLERLMARADEGARAAERVRRQSERLRTTLADMHALAERVERRVAESRHAS